MSSYEQILKLHPTASKSKTYHLWRRLLPHGESKRPDKGLSDFSDSSGWAAAIGVAHAEEEILLLPPAFDVPYEELAAQEGKAKEADWLDWLQISASDAVLFVFMIPLLLSLMLKYLFVSLIAGVGTLYFQLFVAVTFILIALLSPLMMLWWRRGGACPETALSFDKLRNRVEGSKGEGDLNKAQLVKIPNPNQ